MTKKLPLLLLALSAIFSSGCAVMNIDVDVYKGPLANHKDVQTEQLAAMAVGSYPLLQRLLIFVATDAGEKFSKNLYDYCGEKEITTIGFTCALKAAAKLNNQINIREKVKDIPQTGNQNSLDTLSQEDFSRLRLITEVASVMSLYEDRRVLEKAISTEFTTGTVIAGILDKNNPLYSGRTDKGLFSLSDNLVNLSKRCQPVSPSSTCSNSEAERTNALTHALISFAQKTLILANNVSIFRDSRKIKDDEESITLKKYTLILQTIGNSILSLADALTQEESYRKQAINLAQGERTAIHEAFGQSLESAFNDILMQIKSSPDAGTEEKKKAADVLLEERAKTIIDHAKKHTQPSLRARLVTAIEACLLAEMGQQTSCSKSIAQKSPATKSITLTNEKNKALNEIIKKAKALQNPIDPSAFHPAGSNKPVTEVIDDLIAVLRQKNIAALEKFGPGSTQVENASAALLESYRQRAGMIYLRPAVAYLRTSLAATALQDNTVAWSNLLERHSYRTLTPVAPAYQAKKGDKVELQEELDKQFWQNINRIKVSGGGKTNYAIAKDDIGNWYVKSYSADPGPIIESAKNLALFNAGAKVGENLLVKSKQLSEQQKTGTTEPSTSTTGAGRIYGRYLATYNSNANRDLKATMDALADTGLQESIRSAWKQESALSTTQDLLNEKLKASAAGFASGRTALEKLADSSEKAIGFRQGIAITGAMRTLLRFDRSLTKAINGLKSSATEKEKNAAALQKAQEEAKLASAEAERKEAAAREQRARELVAAQGGTTATSAAKDALESATQALQDAENALTERNLALTSTNQKLFELSSRLEAEIKIESLAIEIAKEQTTRLVEDLLSARRKGVEELDRAITVIGDANKEGK